MLSNYRFRLRRMKELMIRVYFSNRYVDTVIEGTLAEYAENIYESKSDDYYMLVKKMDEKEIVIRARDIECIEQM